MSWVPVVDISDVNAPGLIDEACERAGFITILGHAVADPPTRIDGSGGVIQLAADVAAEDLDDEPDDVERARHLALAAHSHDASAADGAEAGARLADERGNVAAALELGTQSRRRRDTGSLRAGEDTPGSRPEPQLRRK